MPALSLYVGKLQEGTKFEIFSEGIKIRKLSERMYRKNVILGLKILDHHTSVSVLFSCCEEWQTMKETT